MKTLLRSYLMLVAIALFAFGCASPMHKQAEKVRVGMEKHDVLELMGNPISTSRSNSIDKWVYVYYQDNQRMGTQLSFQYGKVIAVDDAKLEPSSQDKMNESSSMKEFEKHVREKSEETESGFKEVK